MIQSGLICALVWILMQGTDRLLGWQTLQRPIVTATVTGFLLGDIRTGMIMAASLEAIFMGISAIGGSIPSDACASSIIAVAYTILTGADVETGLAPYWEKMAGSGKEKSYRTQVMLCGYFVDRLPQAIIMFAAIAFGVSSLEHVMNNMPAFIMSGLSASSSMMTGIGFAILLSMIWNKEIGCFFFLGYVLSKYMSLPTVAIAIIAAVIAITYFCNEKKINDVLKIAEKSGASSSVGEEDLF